MTKKKRLIIALAAGIFVILGLWVLVYLRETRPGLPANVAKQVTFEVLFPKDIKRYPVLQESIHHNQETKVLSYSTVVNNKQITINQQAEPETFKEPGLQVSLYQKLLDKMNQYKEIQTDVGTVTLTKPTELNGGQAAALNVKGTLLFAQPVVSLTDDEWRDLFNTMRIL